MVQDHSKKDLILAFQNIYLDFKRANKRTIQTRGTLTQNLIQEY